VVVRLEGEEGGGDGASCSENQMISTLKSDGARVDRALIGDGRKVVVKKDEQKNETNKTELTM
jgi:hypothetical protein